MKLNLCFYILVNKNDHTNFLQILILNGETIFLGIKIIVSRETYNDMMIIVTQLDARRSGSAFSRLNNKYSCKLKKPQINALNGVF